MCVLVKVCHFHFATITLTNAYTHTIYVYGKRRKLFRESLMKKICFESFTILVFAIK